jgi:hypothetical protein
VHIRIRGSGGDALEQWRWQLIGERGRLAAEGNAHVELWVGVGDAVSEKERVFGFGFGFGLGIGKSACAFERFGVLWLWWWYWLPCWKSLLEYIDTPTLRVCRELEKRSGMVAGQSQ